MSQTEQLDRLTQILSTHGNKIRSIRKFDDYFNDIKLEVDKVLQMLNQTISESTGDVLKVDWNRNENFHDRNPHFFAIIIENAYQNINQFLNPDPKYPALHFKGDEISGKVSIFLAKNNNPNENWDAVWHGMVSELTEDVIIERAVDLIEFSYSK